MPEPNELERRLIERIEREGRIPFRDFHESALYDSDFGYYNTERLKIGPAGDFYTSSNVHKAFGSVLARSFVNLWSELHSRVCENSTTQLNLILVEIGAGTGQLAFDIMTSLRDRQPDTFDCLNYLIIETSPAMRRLQREKLSEFNEHIEWKSIEELEQKAINGIVFSNELIDAMPVHRVRFYQGQLQECYVTLNENRRLSFDWNQPSSLKLMRYIERMGVKIGEGWTIEINLDAIDWLQRMSQIIEKGYLVTIDYGDVAGHLYAPDRRAGTLRSFSHHQLIDSLLDQVGERDITASVNFTALMEYGSDAGFETVSYERQSAFLFGNGLMEIIAGMEYEDGSVEDMKERLALKNLFAPGGVSDNFRVLVQRK
jgi:SAM-dependent MidA family methyltransferase